MNKSIAYAGAAAVVLALVLASALALGGFPSGTLASTSGSPSQSSTFEGGNQTYVATYHPPTPDTTTTVSNNSTIQSTTGTPKGVYSYAHNSQVEIVSVSAVVSQGQYVTFSVQYQNIGNGTIYVQEGGGSSLSASISSGTGAVSVIQSPRCLIATTQVPVAPGQAHISSTPGCWSGYYYKLTGTGTVDVQLTLTWTSDSGASQSSSMVITADFTFS